MLTKTLRLTTDDLAAIADLERRVTHHDGGRLKLEWTTLRERPGHQVDDLLWTDGDRLVGFLGIYAFGGPDLEFAGMVDPAARRRGIATSLLHEAQEIVRTRGRSRALLVTPRTTSAGAAFARAHGAELDHSEHFLALNGTPQPDTFASVTLRPAGNDDGDAMSRILSAAFEFAHDDVGPVTQSPSRQTLIAERDGTAVGTVRLALDDGVGGIYGLAVDPPVQGQGIGREILTQSCRELRAQRAGRVTLEVAVDNERALDLYLSVGFQQEATEDYFAVPIAGG
jgi:ribosomal protein S18 acetylase RimI-like enzyme